MEQQDLIKLSILEQQSNQIEEQINAVNQNIAQLEALSLSLLNLDRDKKNGLLAPMGKGIFIESEIKSKKLFVNIGSNILVKKTPQESIEIIENQVKEMHRIKHLLSEQLEKSANELQILIEQAQKEQDKK
ncbi:MAG: prefoldin subunit alpha [Nanoarchaeota archaeon]|nr:prefoldin subunit alpha [Nanoarchaeota archaeon]